MPFSGENLEKFFYFKFFFQADFLCSPVINAEHWLYWGEVDLQERVKQLPKAGDNNLGGRRITHLRVLEQTVFLDDERFEPLGTTFRRGKLQEDYLRKALSSKLDSPGKIAYQNRVRSFLNSAFSVRIIKFLLSTFM